MKQLEINQERLSTLQTDEIMAEHLHRYALALQIAKDRKILDLASGEGYGSYLLSKKADNVFGIDISTEAVIHAKQKYRSHNLEFIQGSAFDIPLPDNHIDLIVSFETIEHHDQHEKMIQECKRVLKPDGILMISSPDKQNYSITPNYYNPYHIKELYFSEFKSLLEKYFKNVKLLNQRYFSGSVIESLNFPSSEIVIFEGNYSEIRCNNNITPIYNIAIASEATVDSIPTSILKHEAAIDKRTEELEKKYINSTTWKIGKFIVVPFQKLRNLFRSADGR